LFGILFSDYSIQYSYSFKLFKFFLLHKASFGLEFFFHNMHFTCEIELIPVKFLCKSCKLPVLQRRP
jgi:hypothetical protein